MSCAAYTLKPIQFVGGDMENTLIEILLEGTPNEECEEKGHFFHALGYVFARDSAGTSFRGQGWHKGSKRQRVFCSRCLALAEIEIAPPTEVRHPANKAIATAAG